MSNKFLTHTDPQIAKVIDQETKRQQQTLMLIPSENYASKAVEAALSSPFGNKYAEGYPGKRYYQGNIYVDFVEQLCIDRAKELFRVPYANVQPLSGSPANFAVQHALLAPGDVLMGLSLDAGGHLTHGAAHTASATYFRSVPYTVTSDGYIDYDALAAQVLQIKPKLIIAGTTAYARTLDWQRFAEIAASVGAWLQADIAHIAGLIAAGVYPSPVQYVDVITTTTHKSLRGPRGAMILVTEKGLARDSALPKKINSAIIPGIQGGPHMNTIAALAVALHEANNIQFKSYGYEVMKNAKFIAGSLIEGGMQIVTGGTDSHMFLADMRPYNILGNTMAEGCEMTHIILNRNGLPHDTMPPFYPSGIRIGTPAITSRGMKEQEMYAIAKHIIVVAQELMKTTRKLGISIEDQKKAEIRKTIIDKTYVLQKVRVQIKKLCRQFPIKNTYI